MTPSDIGGSESAMIVRSGIPAARQARALIDTLAVMSPPDPDSPPTYEEALRFAREWSQNSADLAPYRHHGLETARYGRGFAFLDTISTPSGKTDGYILVTTTARGGGLLSVAGTSIDAVITEHLARAEHTNRYIPDSELSAAHRAALYAYDAGLTCIDEVPGRIAIDPVTADYAEFVLIVLRRNRHNPADTGRKILARDDSLLQSPDPNRRYTQPCPSCGCPGIYSQRYPRAVCDQCLHRTTDRTGRRITGFNTHMSGGMIAYYTDTLGHSDDPGSAKEECVEVTRTGACLVDGRAATMEDARFGGIVVQIAPGH